MVMPNLFQPPPNPNVVRDRIIRGMSPEYAYRETDPAFTQTEAYAGYTFLLFQYFNNQSLNAFAGTAEGPNLHALGAMVGLKPTPSESDEAFRARFTLVPRSQSIGTKEQIEGVAESVSGVQDALLTRDYNAGTGSVYLIVDDSATEANQVSGYPTAAIRTAVTNAVTADDAAYYRDQIAAVDPCHYRILYPGM